MEAKCNVPYRGRVVRENKLDGILAILSTPSYELRALNTINIRRSSYLTVEMEPRISVQIIQAQSLSSVHAC